MTEERALVVETVRAAGERGMCTIALPPPKRLDKA
jgi:hypothetical protein